jgi:diguanylate cyclase (GGDEF)-like protein
MHRKKDAFTSDHVRILAAVSDRIGVAIENAIKYSKAECYSTTDYLTGLPNARSLSAMLDAELNRSLRLNEPLAVLVCDVDGFKAINDRYGHLEGNRVLRALASAMKEDCREYDYLARMGGDEFAILLPGLNREHLAARIARFRQIAVPAGQDASGEEVQLSIGAAACPEDGTDARALLATADLRMYEEKRSRSPRAQRTYSSIEFETDLGPRTLVQ